MRLQPPAAPDALVWWPTYAAPSNSCTCISLWHLSLFTIHTLRCPLQVPKQDEASPYLTGAVTAAVLGTIAYRRPKALAVFAGMVALVTAPYLGFMVVTVNRFGRVRAGWVCCVQAAGSRGQLRDASCCLTK